MHVCEVVRVRVCVCMCVYKRERREREKARGRERWKGGGRERESARPSIRFVQTLGKQTPTFPFTMSLTLRSAAVPPWYHRLTHRIESIALSIWARQAGMDCLCPH